MLSWIRRRVKQRKDGRTVFVTTVVFDAFVFSNLCELVEEDRQRSAVITEAVRHVLTVPGWLDSTILRLAGEEAVVGDAPSPKRRLRKRNSKDGPATRRSPSSRPRAASAKRQPRK